MTFNLRLEDRFYNISNALLWGNSLEHYRMALREGDCLSRLLHLAIGTLECIPLIGQLASLTELAIVSLVGRVSAVPPPASQRVDEAVSERAILQPPPIVETVTPTVIETRTVSTTTHRDAFPDFFVNHVIHTPRWAIPQWNEYSSITFEEEFPDLKECACSQVPVTTRGQLEYNTIDLIAQKFPDKNQPFTLLSVGSGQCFQELIYILRLVGMGYTNLQVVLIDEAVHPVTQDELDRSIADLRRFIQDYIPLLTPKPNIQLSYYSSWETYRSDASGNDRLKPNLMLCIDMQGYGINNQGDSYTDAIVESVKYFKENSLFPSNFVFACTRYNVNLAYRHDHVRYGPYYAQALEQQGLRLQTSFAYGEHPEDLTFKGRCANVYSN